MSAESPLADAKANFAELVRRAERGETVILTRHGRPVARLAPIESPPGATRGGPASRDGLDARETGAPYGDAGRAASGAVTPESRRELLEQLLAESVWPRLPEDQLGAAPSKREREEILGYRVEDS